MGRRRVLVLMTTPAPVPVIFSFAAFNDTSEGRSSQGQKSESSLDHVERTGYLLQYRGLNSERMDLKREKLSEWLTL